MCKLLFMFTTCLIVLNNVLSRSTDSPSKEWDLYKEKFVKSYHNEQEEESRMKTFYKNLESIEKHNKLFEEGKVSFKRAVNKFTDMEYKKLLKEKCGLIRNQQQKNEARSTKKLDSLKIHTNPSDVPAAIDWREKGVVTPVKDQGNCGSCWAFSATGALEGQLFLKTGNLTGLSEQNLVDCSLGEGNFGCGGGFMSAAFQYVIINDGIATEQAYPYEGHDNKCRYSSNSRATGCTDFVEYFEENEDKLKTLLGTVGPVSIGFNVEDDFLDYSEGIYYKEKCNPNNLNHGMLAVGYGTTESGEEYWIVKNSWGAQWGDKGYVKVARNRGNVCGISSEIVYPVL